MRSRTSFRLVAAVLSTFIAGQAVADPMPQAQISFTVGSSGTWNADWMGVAGRVYFFQWSLDLETWHYAPFMEFGSGLKNRGCSSTSQKLFVRLHYVDAPGVTTLQQAKDADFDGDGLSNFDELSIHGTDPLKKDTDGDKLTDREEVIDLGLDPTLSNTGAASGAAQVSHVYDDANRLTGTTSPVAVSNYGPDAEGNLLGD